MIQQFLVIAVGACLMNRLGSSHHFHMLYISIANDTALDYSVSAIDMAIETMASRGKLNNITFSKSIVPWGCEPSLGVSKALDQIIDHKIDVIFGSVCSTVTLPLTYVVRRWNLPIFPEASTTPELNNKVLYPNVIRVNAEYGKMGKAFVEMSEFYGWKNIIIFHRDAGICQYGATGINNNLIINNITVAEWIRHTYTTLPDIEITTYLKRIKQRGRMVMCHQPSDIIRILMRAHDMGMDNGEYVFFYFGLIPFELFYTEPWNTTVPGYTRQEIDKRSSIFSYYKQVTMASLKGPAIDNFLYNVSERMLGPPYYSNYSWLYNDRQGYIYSLFLHDAALLYLDILNETISEGLNPRNGTTIFQKSKNKSIKGITGNVFIDGNADREPDYWLWYSGPDVNKLTPWLEISMNKPKGQRITVMTEPYWGTPDGNPPPDVPVCGLQNEHCPPSNRVRDAVIGSVVTGIMLTSLFCISLNVYLRNKRMEAELNQMLWKVDNDEIQTAKKRASSTSGLSTRSLRSLESSGMSNKSHTLMLTDVGYLRGNLVAIRYVNKETLNLNRHDLLELKELREMSHENLNPFIGACIDPQRIFIISQYCSKGSLQDILENDEIALDWMFKCSLIFDLTNGMHYLHNTVFIGSHGRLSSSNCLIDNRWILKITSYGLSAFRKGELREQEGEYEIYKRQLWTAPELLRMGIHAPWYGTKKGDVFSFAIILQEILYRAMPYFLEILTPKEVIRQVIEVREVPFRPDLPKVEDTTDEIRDTIRLIKDCWHEDPDVRPSFEQIRKQLRIINKGRKVNILDTMLAKLEKYANNLEDIVQQRTAELMEEKKKTDQLLYRMLPEVVADELKQGHSVNPELYDEVTIYFSDIVGFTSLSSESTPMQVVNFLNDLYTLFDDIIGRHDVYKVETIGDAYMCVSGLPQRNGDRHAAEIANMALDLLSAVFTRFRVRHRPDLQLRLRIGIHTGPCAAGVVGLTMPRYCLFGDTVNMASRMESNGLPLRIHLSEEAHKALAAFKVYQMTVRDSIEVKGKGLVTTYWLYGRTGYEGVLPPIE